MGSPWPRGGFGILVLLALIVMATLLPFAIAVSRSPSGASRAVRRVVDVRLLIEAGMFALAEVTEDLLRSLERGSSRRPGGIDWGRELQPPYRGRTLPKDVAIVPLKARAHFSDPQFGISLSPVGSSVVHATWEWEESPPTAPVVWSVTPPLPQGVLEMSVVVEARRGLYSVRRKLIQRRIFYVTYPPPTRSTGEPPSIDARLATAHLVVKPIGTVIGP